MLVRRRRLVAATFLVVLLGTVAVTAVSTPMYEAEATLIPTNEEGELLSAMRSQAFASDVGDQLGENETEDYRLDDVVVRKGTGPVEGGEDETVIIVRAGYPTASGASTIANTYVQTLDQWRPYLENVTWDKKWGSYYEDAGRNETRARENLTALIENRQYWRILDEARAPSQPASPSWQVNLGVAGTLGSMLAVMVPFVVEGLPNTGDGRER